MTIKEKVLKDKFEKLHLKCVKETRELGRATYKSHGMRSEALGRLDEYKKTLAEVGKVIDERILYLKKGKDKKGKKKVGDVVYLHIYDMIRELKELKKELGI